MCLLLIVRDDFPDFLILRNTSASFNLIMALYMFNAFFVSKVVNHFAKVSTHLCHGTYTVDKCLVRNQLVLEMA